ncbi:1-deoxy-D-xylulose-5-phosphate reductoisomerase [Alicyclobacillus sp. SO9]|uniref:1-deoxy-D-xylulose-5-phosphate reductoisomerase n=1 Tax=Alicyclobacillus sp. SO9 TaxID=2665646 RepID=UPI0018E852E4|nr:1-deoxy-D-xylulose-5-phosphate reductoisomerase [Alicyclobacillus sp. SO9]QQE80832.1 1-deoxy-D-xylulose-5-phosphate reductoisomerase [Alicyclobacillus sp. SO9]
MTVKLSILGSTGVIGTKTLEVVRNTPSEYEVTALAAGRNVEELAKQIREFCPVFVSVQDEESRSRLLALLKESNDISVPDIGIGDSGLLTVADVPADVMVTGIVGAKGLLPTWQAILRGTTIALANKETLVSAGELIMPLAVDKGVPIIPVDSEHSALHQSLRAGSASEVHRYVLTASGGPFRTWSRTQLENATVEQALKHPNWTMGKKITVDSATMMNKGLEVIEAHHLFQVSYDRIEVVVHPQSVIHSMVDFVDGSVVAQLATPDMRLPIQYALTFPKRIQAPWPRLSLQELQTLTFEPPDFERFPSLKLAYEAGKMGGYAPCVLNAANEVAVGEFLEGRITFLELAILVERVLEAHQPGRPSSLEDVLAMDKWARQTARTMIRKGG